MSQASNAMNEVAAWLKARAATAPAEESGQWLRRAKLYRTAANLTAYERQYAFRMNATDPTFDPATLDRFILDPGDVAPWGITGPPDTLTIRLHGEIGTANLDALEAEIARVNSIRLSLDTFGGDFMQAMRLYRLLSAKNTTAIVSKAFSAGALILQAAKRRCAMPDAMIMVHGARAFVAGNSAELRQAAEGNDLADQIQREILTARTGQPKSIIESWLSRDSYFSAPEALAAGLIDTVLDNATEAQPPGPK